MDIYLAAPIFNRQQVDVVEMIKAYAEGRGHKVFSPYHNSRDIWQGRAPKDCTPEERTQVLNDNINNIDWCDILLCWVGGMGGFTDPGVVWEMGYAYAKGKFQLVYIDDEMDADRPSMNLMLAGTVHAVVRGQAELNTALAELPPTKVYDPYSAVRALYPPSVLGQEREPIV